MTHYCAGRHNDITINYKVIRLRSYFSVRSNAIETIRLGNCSLFDETLIKIKRITSRDLLLLLRQPNKISALQFTQWLFDDLFTHFDAMSIKLMFTTQCAAQLKPINLNQTVGRTRACHRDVFMNEVKCDFTIVSHNASPKRRICCRWSRAIASDRPFDWFGKNGFVCRRWTNKT